MELITKAPKGTVDIIPGESEKWSLVEAVMTDEAERNGFSEIRTPVFEHTELFLRSVGDTTDVVEKQMYTIEDKGGRSITLRPEGTAGAVRAMLENGLYNGGYPVKLYYKTSCYRYEKPQAGRLRELHQFGVEMFGTAEPAADAQVIAMAMSIFNRLGLDRILMAMNEMGADFGNDAKCEVYIASLGEAAQMKAFQLTEKMHSCGIAADCDLCARGLKAQMKYADKIGAQYSIVLGDDEIANGEAVLKNMKTGEKKKISLNDDFVDTYITAVTEQEDAMPITF